MPKKTKQDGDDVKVIGMKETAIGFLPEKWKVVKLVDISEIRYGLGQPPKLDDSGVPMIRATNIKRGKIISDNLLRVAREAIPKTKNPFLKKNDILVVRSGAYTGDVAMYDGRWNEAIAGYDLIVSPSNQVVSGFIASWLLASVAQEYFYRNRDRAAQSHLNSYQLGQTLSPLPPLSEQKNITIVLSSLQDTIAKTEAVIESLQSLKKAMMPHLFTYGPVAMKETEQVRLKETEIGMIPEEWEVVKLDEISSIRYGLGQPPKLDDSGVPMIRATNIKRGKIISDNLLRVAREAISKTKNPFLKKNDILVVRSGAYTGDVAMYDGRWDEAIAGYDLIVSPKNQVISGFVAYWLLGSAAQSYFYRNRDRAAQPHLNSQQLGEVIVPLPPLLIQQKIAEILSALDAKIQAEESKKASLETLFKTLLELLMTGKIRILSLEQPL